MATKGEYYQAMWENHLLAESLRKECGEWRYIVASLCEDPGSLDCEDDCLKCKKMATQIERKDDER